MKKLEFWLSIGSPHSYISIMRIPGIVKRTGLEIEWHIFSLRQLMNGSEHHPFSDNSSKTTYMWADIGRRANKYGLKPDLPAPFPLDASDLANRVALVAAEEGRLQDYVAVTYRHWFHDGQPAGAEPNLSHSLHEVGLDPETTIAKAEGARIEQVYAQATRKARERGIFGAPSFLVGDELFWGDDRLDDAVSYALPRPRARIMKKRSNADNSAKPARGQAQDLTAVLPLRKRG